MKNILLSLCFNSVALLFSLTTTNGISAQNIHSKVKIDLSNHTLLDVAALGLEADHGQHAPHKYLINIFDDTEISMLDKANIPYQVIIEDVTAYYKEHGTMDETEVRLDSRSGGCNSASEDKYDYVTPENYSYGSMGGYLTYTQVLDNLDQMAELYPQLITKRMAIDTFKTHQDRSLYYLVISNTPGTIDSAKPQILYDALHHAREPNSVSQILFYMWYLLENYGTDEEVTFLVDNTSMFFLPIVNPDGYVYNEEIQPNGGGLWRKNRYPTPSGDTVGVDLNRNYGFFWAYDDQGSSDQLQNATYRGPAAFSEPETQAVRALCNANDFQIALNYHTYGNLLIHPWGYSDQPTAEDQLFKSMAGIMASENDFTIGTGSETVGYVVNGDSDDWMYGEQLEKSKIYSMTPEVGPAFWPSEGSIDQLNKSAMRHNFNAAHLLHNFGWAKEIFVVNNLTATEGSLFFEVEKSGLQNGALSFSVISESPEITLSNNIYNDINLLVAEKRDYQISYVIDPDVTSAELNLVMLIDNGQYIHRIPFTKTFDNTLIADYVLKDTISNTDDYSLEGLWNITDEDAFSPPFSITDSPNRNYRNNTDSEIILLTPLITENAEQAFLKFMTKYEIEPEYDYVQIKVSMDGGAYTDLCGVLTVPAIQFQDERPLYEGFQNQWVQETICLNDYLDAEELRFKFTFYSDQGLSYDGFYFDDLAFEVIGENYTSTQETTIQLLTLAPNPSDNDIRISMHPQDFTSGLRYEIFDMKGAKCLSANILRPQTHIDITNLSEGTHLLMIKDETQLISQKSFVKTSK